jgi:hypothetical protein
MSYSPIAYTIPNYRDFHDYWLKAYEPSTTAPKSIKLDGDVEVGKVQLNADGFTVSAGSALVIPYIEGAYDLWAFPTEAEADANDTSNALRFANDVVASISPDSLVILKYTLAEAVALVDATVGQIVQITDRENAQFEYIAATTNNSYNLVDATGSGLTLSLIVNEWVNVKEFGALGNGSTNDTGACQAALSYDKPNPLKMVFPPADDRYMIEAISEVRDNVHIVGYGALIGQIVLPISETRRTVLKLGNEASVLSKNLVIEGLNISRDSRQTYTNSTEEFQGSHFIRVDSTDNVRIFNNVLTGFQGDGIILSNGLGLFKSKDAVVRDNFFNGVDGQNRNGISVVGGLGVTIADNYFENVSNEFMPGPIDVEPENVLDHQRILNLTGNQCINCDGQAHYNINLNNMSTGTTGEFIIANNISRGAPIFGISLSFELAQFTDASLIISDNIVTGAQTAIQGINIPDGTVISGNLFTGERDNTLWYPGGIVKNTTITDNIIETTGLNADTNPGTPLRLGVSDGLIVANNTLTSFSPGDSCILVGQTGGADSKNVLISDNVMNGRIRGQGAFEGKSCIEHDNIGITDALALPFFMTDLALTSVVSFDGVDIPTDFSLGRSTSCIPAGQGLGLPSDGGVLTCHIPSLSIYDIAYQEFVPLGNGTQPLAKYLRHSNSLGTAWNAWVIFTGV